MSTKGKRKQDPHPEARPVIVDERVSEVATLSPLAHRVYVRLMAHGAWSRWVEIHTQEYARWSHRGQDSVRKALRQLERGGLIERQYARGQHAQLVRRQMPA